MLHNPLTGFYAAITRKNEDGTPEDGYYPEQALSREDALRGYTTGPAYAAFLEDEVGVRFLMQGPPQGTFVPKLDRLTVKADLNVLKRPHAKFVTGVYVAPPYGLAHNHIGSQILWTYGGHSYYDAVPAPKYGKEHPEYFALIGGVRTTSGNHLCVSNPDVQELLLKEMEKMEERFAGAEGFDFAPIRRELRLE